jgi:nitrogen-specific signal transduction histidine kinase/CheY-like chemotaxis protein
MEQNHNILLLDGDEQSALDIQRFLKVSAYTFGVSHASDVQEGLNYLRTRMPEIILLDAQLTRTKDFEAFRQMVTKEKIPVILLSQNGGAESRHEAESVGAHDYIIKNKINLFHLQKTILNTLKITEAEAKLGNSFNQSAQQQATLYNLLNKTSSSVIIISPEDFLLYANDRAYTLLSEDGIRNQLAGYLTYRKLEKEEFVELHPGNVVLKIRMSEIDWSGAQANLFIIDRFAAEDTAGLLADESFISLLNSLNENIILLRNGRMAFANKVALKTFNLSANEVNGRQPVDFFEGYNTSAQVTVKSFVAEKVNHPVLKLADGTQRKIKLLSKPVTLAGEFYELLTFAVEGGAQDHLMPKGRSDEDQFTTDSVLHLASHDLREPVRTILNYVQLISENLHKQKYEAATEYADFAKAAADRMEKLLSDFKVYIALNDYKPALSKVSMKMAVADVLKQLKSTITSAEAEINVAELPDVNADRDLVEKLVLQLLDNALKFGKKGKKLVIDIGFDKYEGNILFCVRDNGMGIPKKYQDKIFEPFERLNRVDEFPGNGLGLAISKKIIELHKGKLWIESLPGFGSSFYFTL